MSKIMYADQVFEKLKKSAKSQKTIETLTKIHSICHEQYNRGTRDFTIATICRLGEGSGVPSSQSIRNKSGEIYRTLISAWKAHIKQESHHTQKSEFDWVDELEEPIHRFLITDLLKVNRELRGELQICKSIKKLHIDLREAVPPSQECQLSPTEINALSEAINPEMLTMRGWKKTTRGSIVDTNGRTIMKNGFVTALTKILSANS